MDAKATLTVLARLAQRVPAQEQLLDRAVRGRLDKMIRVATEVAIETGGPLPRVLSQRLESEGTSELAEFVADHVPDQASCLRDTRLWAIRRRLEDLPKNPLVDPERGRERGSLLVFLAMEYQELGDNEAALVAANEALNVQSALLGRSDDVELGDPLEVPVTLRVLGSILYELGDLERSLTSMEQATTLYGLHAKLEPRAYLEHLASAQSEHAEVLDELGRSEDASRLRQAGISNLRRLLDEYRSNSPVDNADRLHTLGCLLAEEGELVASRDVLEQAIEVQRELTSARPQQFNAAFAENLYQLGNVLLRLGDNAQAEPHLVQSTELWQSVVELGTKGAIPDLARAHLKLAECLHLLEDRRDALQNAETAIDLLRELPDGMRGGAIRTELAAALTLLARIRADALDVDGATAALNAAKAIDGNWTPREAVDHG